MSQEAKLKRGSSISQHRASQSAVSNVVFHVDDETRSDYEIVGAPATAAPPLTGQSRVSSSKSKPPTNNTTSTSHSSESSDDGVEEDRKKGAIELTVMNPKKEGGGGAADGESKGLPLKKKKKVYYDNASFFSRVTFSWLNRVLARGRADKLREEDLRLPTSLRTEEAYQSFMNCWNKERESEYPSLIRALWTFSKREFLITAFFKLLWSALLILCAYYLVRSLVAFVSEKKDNPDRSPDINGPGLSLAMLGATMSLSVAQHQMNNAATALGIKVRGAMMTAVFRKALKMENVSKHSAYILNLITNDCNRLMEACLAVHSLYAAPLEAFTIVALLIVLTGEIAFIALGLLLIIVPLQYYIGKRIAYLRNKNIAATDQRVNLMHEVLMAIKLVKFYSWESSFMEDVKELRQKEIAAIEKGNNVKTLNLMTVFWIPPIIALCVFSLYVKINGTLAATIAFTTLSLFNTLRFPLVILPKALKNFAESNAAIRRIEQLLLQPELSLLREGVQPKHMKKGKDIVAFVDEADDHDKQSLMYENKREVSLTKKEAEQQKEYDETEREIIISFQRATIGYIQNLAEIKKKKKGKQKKLSAVTTNNNNNNQIETQAEKAAREKEEEEEEKEEEKEQEKQVTRLKRAASLIHQNEKAPHHDEASLSLSVPVLRNVTFELEKGMKLCIAGPVASGKSSLLQAILGEARVISGRVHTHGTIGYVPQFPWIQSGTVRDNITFGKEWNEEKYKKVVFACALEHDLAILPNGDQTFIAERGMNLSGGQRQRISIARAAYSDHEVMVLDSPLSAVDYHTGQHIINHCFNGLMAGKTIILVTHQLHLLCQFDRVAIIKNNHLVYFGPYRRDIVKREFPLFEEEGDEPEPDAPVSIAQRQTANEAHKKIDADEEKKASDAAASGSEGGELVSSGISSVSLSSPVPAASVVSARMAREEASKKSNSKIESLGAGKAFLVWVKEGGVFWFVLAMSVAALTQTSRIFSDWWVSRWSATPSTPSKNSNITNSTAIDLFNSTVFEPSGGERRGGDLNLTMNQYNWIYSILVFAFFVLLINRGLSFYHFAVRSATSIHNKMFQRVLRAPMYFFSRSPLGGVIDAFSADQDCVDQALPDTFHITTVFGYILFTTIILVSVILPLYSVVLVLLILSFVIVSSYYLKTATVVKGLVAKTSSPVVSHISESLEGINVLRAFGSTDRFQELSVAFINRSHSALFNLEQLQLWLAFRLDLVACLLVFATALLCTLSRDSLLPSTAGLAISSSMQKLVFFAWVVRGLADIISLVSSVDHIDHYTRTIDQEDDFLKENRPPKNWPSQGNIVFDNVSLNYFPGGPLTLKKVSFSIQAREKIGVIGRTGSGKSTLVMALFRLIECLEGRIIVDGEVLKDFGLSDVRSKFAIIPQEPVMFRGTVRTNLDPFNEYSDEEVWRSLELAHLKESMLASGQTLDMPVDQGGGNFSLGQKQLVCLARALLKKTPILVLDEATAAMDLETDQLIQKTIKTQFADRTVITIAHRLDTIIQSDKILGMSSGEVVEFDTPRNLLSDPNSFFSQLVARAGKHSESLKKTVFGTDYVITSPQKDTRSINAAAAASSSSH